MNTIQSTLPPRLLLLGLFAAGCGVLPRESSPDPSTGTGMAAAEAEAAARPDPSPVESHRVQLTHPIQWSTAEPAEVRVPTGRATALRGRVLDEPQSVVVRLDGRRLAVERDGRTGAQEFSGFINPQAAPGEYQAELWIEDASGQVTLLHIPFTVENEVEGEREVARRHTGRRWAVVIGVGEYVSTEVTDLATPAADARAIADFLMSRAAGGGGYPADQVRLLVDTAATARNIRSALTTFLRQATPDDIITVYLAGHALPDPGRLDDMYLIAHDSEMGELAATGISMEWIGDALAEAHGYQKMILADVAHSAGVHGPRHRMGNRTHGRLLELAPGGRGGWMVVTASESGQLTQPHPTSGHGLFAHRLLDGLRGEGDEDGDGIVAIGELAEYVRDRVRRDSGNSQIPTISLTSYDRFWPMSVVLDP